MADEKLVNVVKSNLSKGYSVQQIRNGLLEKGWPGFMIDGAINQAASKPVPSGFSQQPVNVVQKNSSHLLFYIGIVSIIIILLVGGFLIYNTYANPVSISGNPSDELSEFQEPGSSEEDFSSGQVQDEYS